MEGKSIAIILVNYNGINDTIECVKSIIKNNFKNYKIVIVENGSEDKNTILSDRFLIDNADVIVSDINVGFSGGNNIGIGYAKKKYNPDYFLLLNNDTVITENAIGLLLKYSQINPDAGIVTGKIMYYSMPDTIWYGGGVFNYFTGIADQPKNGMCASSHCVETSFATGCLMLIHKTVIETVGLLDESYFLYAEDTDFCCRVMNAGYKIIYVPEAIIYHKVSASTGNKSIMQQYYMMRNNCYIAKKYCKIPAYGYARRWFRVLRDCCRKECDLNIHIKAWKDFRKNITGKVTDI